MTKEQTMDDTDALGIIFFGGLASIGLMLLVVSSIGTEKLDFQKANVTSVYLKDGSTACYFDRSGNTGYDVGCPFHVGQQVTVYHDGNGVWHIQK